MTVQSNASYVTYQGGGTTGPFSFSFNFFEESDIVVTKMDSTGVSSTLSNGADYTLNYTPADTTSVSNYNGSITLTSALAVGETLTISRVLPVKQQTSFPNNGAFFADLHEKSFDYLTMLVQQLAALAGTFRVTVSSATTNRTDIITDASLGNQTVDINGLGEVFVSKSDTTANTVTIQDSSGATILRQSKYTLYNFDEGIHLKLFGANWSRIA